jgi:hypothetical protein
MVRHLRVIACVLLFVCFALPACGGGKKDVKDPEVKETPTPRPPPPPETEEDRERKRQAAARQLVPEDSNCLPDSIKGASAPRLELAQINGEAVVCAIDGERDRLLGVVACWKVNVETGDLAYQKSQPLPGRGFSAKIDGRCARGYCLPKDASADATVAHLAWSPDGSKVAVNIGDDVHIFDADSKARESSFTIRGDKGATGEPVRVYWVGEVIFVEVAGDGPSSPVWGFKVADGEPMGALEPMGKGGKPLSTYGGSFVVLDPGRVAVAEQGFSTLTSYEVGTGKRAKLVRKLPKTPCKAAETDAFWGGDTDKVPDKCKAHMEKTFAHLVGADAVAGKKSLLVLLRGPRLGEMAVMDAKSLAEVRVIRMPWCSEEGGGTD